MGNRWLVILQKDIDRCDDAMSRNDKVELWELYQHLYPKYLKEIVGLNLGVVDDPANSFNNIKLIKEKIEMHMARIEQQEKYDSLKQSNVLINANNTNNNTNTNSTSVNVSFEDAKKVIENMGSLTEPEINEALKKVDELEKIVNSTDRKTKKWENAKEIIKWIADKGVDVGISLLPLLLKIQ